MTDLEKEIARLVGAYDTLPALVKLQGGKFFTQLFRTLDAVKDEAADLRRAIEEIA